MPFLVGAADRLPNLGSPARSMPSLAAPAAGCCSPICRLLADPAAVSGADTGLSATRCRRSPTRSSSPACAQHGIDYARVRLWGSVGFVAASLAGGGDRPAFCGCGDPGGAGRGLPRRLSPRRCAAARRRAGGLRRSPTAFAASFADPGAARALIAGSLVLGARRLLRLRQPLLGSRRAFSGRLIGALWAFSVVAEIGALLGRPSSCPAGARAASSSLAAHRRAASAGCSFPSPRRPPRRSPCRRCTR